MSAEALHLSVNLLDRYLSKAWVKRSELQLAGAAALLIACKYMNLKFYTQLYSSRSKIAIFTTFTFILF